MQSIAITIFYLYEVVARIWLRMDICMYFVDEYLLIYTKSVLFIFTCPIVFC